MLNGKKAAYIYSWSSWLLLEAWKDLAVCWVQELTDSEHLGPDNITKNKKKNEEGLKANTLAMRVLMIAFTKATAMLLIDNASTDTFVMELHGWQWSYWWQKPTKR